MTSRYVIYGAGAIGGVIGGCLAAAGHPVALIARGAHLEAIVDRGLEVRLPDGVTHRIDVPRHRRPGPARPHDDDVVVLAMKTQHTAAALETLAATAPPGMAVVCAQNGVDNERQALRRFAAVYGMCVMLPPSTSTPASSKARASGSTACSTSAATPPGPTTGPRPWPPR